MFTGVRIEAFRGFNEPVELDLDGSAVILRGPNGTGKTSFFDAFQWLLLGDLPRLAALREHRNDEYIVNAYRDPGPAVVEAELRLGGETAKLTREGNHRGSSLTWQSGGTALEGSAAEEMVASRLGREGLELSTILLSSGLLQQDVVTALLVARPAERFAQLSRLLQLGDLEEFQKAVERACAAAKARTERDRRSYEAIRSSIERTLGDTRAIRAVVEGAPEAAEATRLLGSAARDARHAIVVDLPVSLDERLAGAVAREAALLRRRLSDARLRLNAVRDVDVTALGSLEAEISGLEVRMATINNERAALQKTLSSAAAGLREAETTAKAMEQLAALATPLLTDTCPVCDQPIDAEHVAQELARRADTVGDLVALRRAAQEAEASLGQHATTAATVEADLASLKERRAHMIRAREVRDDVTRELVELMRGDVVRAAEGLRTGEATRLEDAEEHAGRIQWAAERAAVALGVGSEAAKLTANELTLASGREREEAARQALERASQAEERVNVLLRATKEARVEVVEKRFSRLRPLLRDFFVRLDAHRSFTELDLEPQLYGRPGTSVMAVTRDLQEEVSMNPALVFSSSQANVAALCYFLALAWSNDDATLPFLMLDDPLQSMDDVNVLAFADLCRFLRVRKQIFLSTHERRFADLLERKLAPRTTGERTIVIAFGGWSRQGPELDRHELVGPSVSSDNLFVESRTANA